MLHLYNSEYHSDTLYAERYARYNADRKQRLEQAKQIDNHHNSPARLNFEGYAAQRRNARLARLGLKPVGS